jgi:oligopeptide transport system permease protein
LDPAAVFFCAFLGAVSLLAIFGDWIVPFAPDAQDIARKLELPSSEHWFGTDALGRDLLSRVIQGSRLSLLIGLASTVFAMVVGTATGAIAGFYGRWVDRVLTSVTDFFAIFPSLLLAILLSILLGRGTTGILLSIGIVAWVQHARLVRAQVIQARTFTYVESARSLGVKPMAILFRHILPNLWGPIIISASAQVPGNIMSESFLSFLGLGLQPPFASWGTLASEGTRVLRSHPHLLFLPATVLFLTLLATQYLGDWLRDHWTDASRKNR